VGFAFDCWRSSTCTRHSQARLACFMALLLTYLLLLYKRLLLVACFVLLTFSFSVLSLSFSSRCSATEAPCCLPSSRAALSLSRTAEKSSMSVSSSPPHQYFERILRFLHDGVGSAVICSTFDRIDSHCALDALGSS